MARPQYLVSHTLPSLLDPIPLVDLCARVSLSHPHRTPAQRRSHSHRLTNMEGDGEAIDYREGRLGPLLAQAKPLLHIEVHDLLVKRKAQQREWCDELSMLGVHKGQAEGYTHWETHQAPFIQDSWLYTGVGECGVGQGATESAQGAKQLAAWHHLRVQLSAVELPYAPSYVDAMGGAGSIEPVGRFTAPEVATLCNLAPADAEEAVAVCPRLQRFNVEELSRECQRVQQASGL